MKTKVIIKNLYNNFSSLTRIQIHLLKGTLNWFKKINNLTISKSVPKMTLKRYLCDVSNHARIRLMLDNQKLQYIQCPICLESVDISDHNGVHCKCGM